MKIDGREYDVDRLECYLFAEHVYIADPDTKDRLKELLRSGNYSDDYLYSFEDRAIAFVGPPGLTVGFGVIPRAV